MKPKRLYARFAELDDGRIVGQIENSLSMGYSDKYVRVYNVSLQTANPWYVKKLPYATKLNNEEEIVIVRFFIVRVSGKVDDFLIDFSPLEFKDTSKFYRRNLPFAHRKWEDYNGNYEKEMCSIKLKDNIIHECCWPNAGIFYTPDGTEIDESLVSKISCKSFVRDGLFAFNFNY